MAEKKESKALPIIIGILALLITFQGIFLLNLYKQNKQISSELGKTKSISKPASPRGQLSGQISGTPVRKPGRTFQASRPSNPFIELQRMQQDMERMMGNIIQHAAIPFQNIDIGSSADYLPSADMEETKDKVIYQFDIPGLEKDKIQAKVQNGILLIQGERKSEKQKEDTAQGFYSSEIRYGSFSRSMPLPPYVDEGSVEASYENGVLTVTFDKLEGGEKQTKVIPVM